MKQAPKKQKPKSLLKRMSGADIMKMAGPDVKAWAMTNKIATSKEIDAMPLVRLEKLYMDYLKSKGQ
jgi:hypothetical protein